jgi:hypothetical protein
LNSSRESISTFSQQFSTNDLVIWDNFPDGLVKRNLENAFGAVEIVNARSVQNLYIALKPTYLEMYRGLTIGIPDIYAHEITCDLATMKALIKAYGMQVEQYREVFKKYISSNVDTIAKVLWQKQPLSLTVVDFYKAVLCKAADRSQTTIDSSKCIQLAQEWLPVYDYFIFYASAMRRDLVELRLQLLDCKRLSLQVLRLQNLLEKWGRGSIFPVRIMPCTIRRRMLLNLLIIQ